MGLANISDPMNLDLANSKISWVWQASQVQDNVGLTNMSDPKNLDLGANQTQGSVSLTNMSGLKNFDLAANQAQGSVGHVNIRPKALGIDSQSSPRYRRSRKHVRSKELELGNQQSLR